MGRGPFASLLQAHRARRPKEATTSAPKRVFPIIARTILAATLVATALVAPVALADTKGELDSAKATLGQAQAALDRATAAWNEAESRLAQTRDEISRTQAEVARLERQVAAIQTRLQRRAVIAFESGTGGGLDVLLSSSSFTEFSDRLEFLGSIAQADTDLVTEQMVAQEQLTRKEQDLAALSDRQAEQVASLKVQEQAIGSRVADLQRRVEALTAKLKEELKLKEEQQASTELRVLGQSPAPGAAIAICPVAGPNSFVDSFGWPRSGGRTHQGTDLISPYGTPIVAVQSGNAVATPNSLGGNAVIVYGPGGDWTYYAHLSSYGATGGVGVGTVIGYVGATGDTNVNHLHFEYHPGGGSAVNPYLALRAVC